MKPDVRCVVCEREYSLDAIRRAGIIGCPDCGTTLEPVYLAHDGYVRVNWQDLRMLAIFATRWSRRFDRSKRGNRDTLAALENIIEKLERYQPKNSRPLMGDNEPDNPTITIVIENRNSAPKKLKDGSVLSPFQPRRK